MRKLFICFGLLFSCGEQGADTKIIEIEKPVPIPCDPGSGGGGESGTSWAEMRTLFNRNCVQCHANDAFGQSEAAMRASLSEAKIRNRSMPPNQNAMSEADRDAMLNFF
jgi:hypothetical protein